VADEVASWNFDKVWDLEPSTNAEHFAGPISALESIVVDAIRAEPESDDNTTATATAAAIDPTCSALEVFKSQLHALDKHEQAIEVRGRTEHQSRRVCGKPG
jgi:hypothetical protein